MNDAVASKEKIPPYVAYKTLVSFLETLKASVPPHVDRSLMGRYSGSAKSQLLQSLQYLGLITDAGTAAPALKKLVAAMDNESDYERELGDVLRTAYPFLFAESGDTFDLASSTYGQLEQKFQETRATGDTVRRCTAFFLNAAKVAKLPLSPHISDRARRPRASETKNKRPRKGKAVPPFGDTERSSVAPERPPIPPLSLVPGPDPRQERWQMLLAKFPDFDPAWPEDLKRTWFKDFDRFWGQESDEQDPL